MNTVEDDRHGVDFRVATLCRQGQLEHHHKLGLEHFQCYEFSETGLALLAHQEEVVFDMAMGQISAPQFPRPGLSLRLVETPLPSLQGIHCVVVMAEAFEEILLVWLAVALEGTAAVV